MTKKINSEFNNSYTIGLGLKFIKPLVFTLTERFPNNAKNTTTLACGLGDFSATKANKKLICHINGISNNKNYSKFNDSCIIGMKFMKTFFSLLFFFLFFFFFWGIFLKPFFFPFYLRGFICSK